MMASLIGFEDVIFAMFEDGRSDREISAHLTELGLLRGASERSLRQFRAERGLVRKAVSDGDLETAIAQAIVEVGPSFGRKMMTGYLASKGVHASEVRVGKLMSQMHEPYHQARCQGAKNLNPQPYEAEYMGHKMHIDQNEKLVMFGVTHVVAIDGYSKKIVGHSTMPIKNNLTIYEQVYRNAVLSHGVGDQIRVDHGREFFLTLFMQDMLSEHRFNQERMPYLQTTSTMNHTVERIWPEVSGRVNYPVKTALVQMVDRESLDMDDELTKFCVSNLTCLVSQIGLQRVVNAWNAHCIPGKGIPNHLAQDGCRMRVGEDLLPGASAAAGLYRQEMGSALTAQTCFGTDPFQCEEDRFRAEAEFNSLYPDLPSLFDFIVNKQYSPYQDCLTDLINITKRHS